MYIKEIRLQNVRGFHDARDVTLDLTRPDGSLAGWTVLAGRNGSGKTSLLRAVALAIGGPGVARNLVSDFANWVSVGESQAVAAVQLAYDEEVDWFGIGEPAPHGPFWAGLGWDVPQDNLPGGRDRQPAISEQIPGSGDKATPRRGPWDDNPIGWFCAAYGPFRRLAGGSGDVQRLMLGMGPAARMASLFHEDASLAEGVSWLIEQHLRSLEQRPGAEELKEAALAVLGDGLLPDGYAIQAVNSDGLWVERGGHRFPLREMSDGYRTVAALVVDLLKQVHEAYGRLDIDMLDGVMTVFAPGVVIIDEVDAHLHVSWQKRIGGWLKRHFPQTQFIVTTHSPYICQAADENGLIRLPGPDENRPPQVVEQDLYERIVYGSGDDAVMSELFGLDTPYSERAVTLRRELVELETHVVSGNADEREVRRYEELRDLLTSSPPTRVDELSARLAASGEQQRP
ncbi:AAA family ATPase [Paractinoplanes atraurantiacus]|uniref:AAA domain-containing protein n=1 Tax=Paractinoplanes atraurantiacus TaxID=1036182 RepID=A0A285JX17_9ACTN|nr:AAA family ATPase [Actinoplanes atraurantiacus]SNY64859.1 AAA domain-containing protein [Actinoplanes atraurantiacus]